MRIGIWRNGHLKDYTINDLKLNYRRRTWIDISDPTVEDLEEVAENLKMPGHILVGKLRFSYSHVDSYPEYTKIFAWYLSPSNTRKDFLFDRSPVVVFTNGASVITISSSKTGVRENVAKRFNAKNLTDLSVPARVIYLTITHLLQGYEHFAEQFEGLVEKLEGVVPPWSRHVYVEAFSIRKEANSLFKLLRHFRIMLEFLARNHVYIAFTEEEKRILDTAFDRAIGTEEMTEKSLETARDLINMHLDTVSHDLNRNMRLLAAIAVIVALPTLIGSLLGMNLVDQPWPWRLWQIASIDILVAVLLSAYFYRKGWLGGT